MSNYLYDNKIMTLLGLVSDGVSNRKIAKILKISRTTVRRYAKDYWKYCLEEENEKHHPLKGGYWHHKRHLE